MVNTNRVRRATSGRFAVRRGGSPHCGPVRRASVSLVLLALVGAAPSSAQEPRLFYEEDGDGPPVVLIADWAHDTSTWFRLLPALRPGLRLVRYDLRAHGRSESPA